MSAPVAARRKIVAMLAVSADGFIARPNGAVDWLEDPRLKGDYGMGAFYKSIDTILWGRKTYEMALAFQAKGIPGSAFDTRVRNYVFTRTLSPARAAVAVQFTDEPIKSFAGRLRAAKGKNIWMMGGGGIIASFLDEGEIDEFILHVIPVMIGEGIPLLAPRHRTVPLRLIESTKFSDGVVGMHYAIEKQNLSAGKRETQQRTGARQRKRVVSKMQQPKPTAS